MKRLRGIGFQDDNDLTIDDAKYTFVHEVAEAIAHPSVNKDWNRWLLDRLSLQQIPEQSQCESQMGTHLHILITIQLLSALMRNASQLLRDAWTRRDPSTPYSLRYAQAILRSG
jgi:hypothetical protein